jgi:hypothetical protein
MLYGIGNARVCAAPICGPCSSRFGNEGIFQCQIHSGKENIPEVINEATAASESKKSAKIVRQLSILQKSH